MRAQRLIVRDRTPAVALALLLAATAHGQSLSLDRGVSVRAEVNDNLGLSPTDPQSTQSGVLRFDASLARESETVSTRLSGALTGRAQSPDSARAVEGRFEAAQTVTLASDVLSLSGTWARDAGLAPAQDAIEATLGAARPTTATLSGGWTRRATERLDARVQGGATRTRYDGNAFAGDFSDGSVLFGAGYRTTPTTTASADWTRSRYELATGLARSDTDSLRLTLEHTLDEVSAVSVSVGRYLSRRRTLAGLVVCPVQASLCRAGLVPPVVVPVEIARSTTGTSGSLAWRRSFDEVGAFSVTAARQLVAGGLGVLQSDELRLIGNRALSPRTRLEGGVAWTQSAPSDATPELQPRLLAADLSWSRSLDEWTRVVASGSWRRYSDGRPGAGARSTGLSISLQYNAPRISMTVE